MRTVLLRGCRPEVAAGTDGRILAVGAGASQAAGTAASVHELSGQALPGLSDAHIHLEGLAMLRLTVDLSGCRSLAEVLSRVRRFAARLPPGAWVVGRGWYNDAWPDPTWPHRRHLDQAVDGRPALLVRKDGHSAWLSSEGLRLAGFSRDRTDPPGGVIDRDPQGEPTGIVRERAADLARSLPPEPDAPAFDRALLASLRQLSRLGLTSAHSMDSVLTFASLQRLHAGRRLPLRVTFNLPSSHLAHAERLGIRSGWGDHWLRIWGVKAFLDGSLGSRTAEMLDGSGTTVLPQPELLDLVRRCAEAELNVCLHAIGDGAVRRALDALEPHRGAWPRWRPRIEHAQAVHPNDQPRFRRAGVIASMQPIHALADRELAEAQWNERTVYAYAWRALSAAGARLAFGSDAPVEDPSPLLGLEAATSWRRRVGWHPGLALTKPAALTAYTSGCAYAVGMERQLGVLRAGRLCDVTVVEDGRVVATVVGARLTWPG